MNNKSASPYRDIRIEWEYDDAKNCRSHERCSDTDTCTCQGSHQCSSPSLIRPPFLPINYGNIREVAFGEGRSKYADSSSYKDLWPY